jgi:hypothetical protein
MMRKASAALLLVVLTACAPTAQPSGDPSNSPSTSQSESVLASACDGAVLVPVKESGWQVCLPPETSVAISKTSDVDFEVSTLIADEKFVVGRYRVWKAKAGDRPDAEAWVLLGEDSTNQQALYGRNEVSVPGNVSAEVLEQLNTLGIEQLLDPERYSLSSD